VAPAGTRCRANAHGAANLMAARNRSFFWFLLPSQLDAPAGNQQNSSTHPEANMGTLPMQQT
jgi:hypothetical protein